MVALMDNIEAKDEVVVLKKGLPLDEKITEEMVGNTDEEKRNFLSSKMNHLQLDVRIEIVC